MSQEIINQDNIKIEKNAEYSGVEFRAVSNSGEDGFSVEQREFLKTAKEQALEKIASFEGATQDPYPTPFLNLSDTQIPKTTSEIFKWCKYFYTFDPLIAGSINALSNFPITEVYFEDKEDTLTNDESKMLKTYKRVFYEKINIYKLLVEIGIDYYLYGNCFIFGEMWTNPANKEIEWKSMTRLDPSKIIIDYNPVTQEKTFKWQLPARIIDIVRKKKPKAEYDKIPDIIKEAVVKRGAIVLNSNNIYHFARPTDSMGDNNVWGTPIIANVLKLLMYRNVLRQAQEAIAREHIVPMRIYYLQRTADYNPQGDWNATASSFAAELMKSVRDPNHKVVSPVPVNVVNVGGEGRALLLTPEIDQVQNEILAGMNVPREFIFGGVSYSGTSLSLKILENQFITYRLLIKDFLQNFCVKNMAKARKEWCSEDDDDSLITAKLNDLKMQDDVQQKQLILEMNRTGKISDTYVWKMLGLDPDKMKDMLEKEAVDKIELDTKLKLKQLDAELIIQKKQLQIQMVMGQYQRTLAVANGINPDEQAMQTDEQLSQGASLSPGDTQGDNLIESPVEPQPTQEQPPDGSTAQPEEEQATIRNTVMQIRKLPKDQRDQVIAKLPAEIQKKINILMSELDGAADSDKIDMRAMPEQRPPRRDSLK